jgi:hypothetical protein
LFECCQTNNKKFLMSLEVEFIEEAPFIVEFETIGPPGKSAYQSALDNGFVGTEAEWIASLGGSQDIAEVLAEGNDANGQQIKNAADPTDPQDLATKEYVDNNGGAVSSVNTKTGDVVLDASDVGADPAGSAAAAIAAANTYAESLVVGLWDDRGVYNASSNLFPATGGSGTAGAIKKGDIWTVSVAGTLGGSPVTAGDTVRALSDTPGQTSTNWAVAETNIGYVPENASNKDVSGGYPGLTLFKINFKNVLGTFISWFTNSNTAARTYTFQDRNGTIANDTDLALKADKQTGLISGGGLSIVTDDITVAIATYYIVGFGQFTSVATVFNNIALSSAGTQRFVAFYGQADSTIIKVEGAEGAVAAMPSTPANTALINYSLVTDGNIGSGVDTSGFEEKSNKQTTLAPSATGYPNVNAVNAGLTQPSAQVIIGTGTGQTSSSGLTFDSANNVLKVGTQASLGTSYKVQLNVGAGAPILFGTGGGGAGHTSIWFDRATPTSINYSISSDGISTYINGPTATGFIHLRVNSNTIGNIQNTIVYWTTTAATSGASTVYKWTTPLSTSQTAGAETIGAEFDFSASSVQHASNTAIATNRDFVIKARSHRFVTATGTITDAGTLVITGPPIASTNAAITNAYSLWSQSGKVRFQGLPAAAAGLQAGDLWNNGGVLNIV